MMFFLSQGYVAALFYWLPESVSNASNGPMSNVSDGSVSKASKWFVSKASNGCVSKVE